MHLSENFIYNLGDIFRNLIEGRQYIADSNFTMYGQSIGQIVADLFFINPHDRLVWTEENSAVIFGAGQTYKIQSEFFDELEVQSSRPGFLDFSLPNPDFFTTKKNRKYEAINKLIEAKPKLQKGDQDLPIVERINKIKFHKKKSREQRALDELEAVLDSL